jgi:CMP-N-acetylneuraminic acid synthetase
MICVIPSRGGSRRIPRKNIKLFHGKPIIAYSIELAKKSYMTPIVSTEHEEIAQIAKDYGARVFWRFPA